MRIAKANLISIVLILLFHIFSSCGEDGNANSIKLDWKLDINDYLDLTFPPSTAITFQPVLLENGLALLHVYDDSERFLIEVNLTSKQFVSNTAAIGYNRLRKRNDGSVLVTKYNYADDLYSIGTYNQTSHEVEYFSNIKSEEINEPIEIKQIYPGDDCIYTHNPNLNPENTDEVYLSKWNLNGQFIWKEIIDPTSEFKISSIQSIQPNHVILKSVSGFDQIGASWKIEKISSDGEIIWSIESELGDVTLFENKANDFFLFNFSEIAKYDSDGNELWRNSNIDFGIIKNALTTSDGGLILQVEGLQKTNLLKINNSGKIQWNIEYWENHDNERGNSLDFLELSDEEFIVTSLNGFITKYSYHAQPD